MKSGNITLPMAILAFILTAANPSFGMNWTQINTNGFGDANNQGINGTYYNQKMYIATGKESDNGIPGTPIKVFEYDGSTWKQVNVDGFGDSNNMMGGIGMTVYHNLMYVGTKNDATGTQIWTYDGTNWLMFYDENDADFPYSRLVVYKDKLYFASGFGDPPDSRNRVLAYNGTIWSDTNFDDGNANEKIDDLATYDGKLFLSTYSEGNGCQVWSYDESDWELVADAGFGDTDNYVGLSMTVHDNRLLVCTANLVSGGQLWAYDGEDWTQINISGFGNADNTAVLANSYEGTLYAGTFSNETEGELWLLDGQDWIRINTGSDFNDAVSGLATGSIGSQLGLFVVSDYGI